MNPIQTETKGIRPIAYNGGNDLSYYTYLKDTKIPGATHFEMNENHLSWKQTEMKTNTTTLPREWLNAAAAGMFFWEPENVRHL